MDLDEKHSMTIVRNVTYKKGEDIYLYSFEKEFDVISWHATLKTSELVHNISSDVYLKGKDFYFSPRRPFDSAVISLGLAYYILA